MTLTFPILHPFLDSKSRGSAFFNYLNGLSLRISIIFGSDGWGGGNKSTKRWAPRQVCPASSFSRAPKMSTKVRVTVKMFRTTLTRSPRREGAHSAGCRTAPSLLGMFFFISWCNTNIWHSSQPPLQCSTKLLLNL